MLSVWIANGYCRSDLCKSIAQFVRHALGMVLCNNLLTDNTRFLAENLLLNRPLQDRIYRRNVTSKLTGDQKLWLNSTTSPYQLITSMSPSWLPAIGRQCVITLRSDPLLGPSLVYDNGTAASQCLRRCVSGLMELTTVFLCLDSTAAVH